MRRAKVSTPPPGDTGTTMRIGRLGKTACARTIPGASTTPAVARSDEIASRRFVGMALTGCRSLLYYRERHQIEMVERSCQAHGGRMHHGSEECDPYNRPVAAPRRQRDRKARSGASDRRGLHEIGRASCRERV